MRRGHHGQGIIIAEDGGQPIGFSLGADFTSEHEWGIKTIQENFGIGKLGDVGVESRQMTYFPKENVFLFKDKYTEGKQKHNDLVLYYSPYTTEEPKMRGNGYNAVIYPPYGHEDATKPEYQVAAAWDEKGFIIRARGEEYKQILRDIYEAMDTNDVMITNRTSVFLTATFNGLALSIISRLNEDVKDEIRAADIANKKMHAKADATGLVAYVMERNGGKKPYFAMSPRDEEGQEDGLIWWLNPTDQKNVQFGWFTTSQLRDWADGKGPVLEKKIAKT